MFSRVLLPLVLVVAGFVGGIVATGWVRAAEGVRADVTHAGAPPAMASPATAPSSSATAERASATQAPAGSGGGPDFTRVAGQAVKGVANISSLQVVRTRNSPFSDDPFFRYFFGDDQMYAPRDRRSLSLGSGVIISPDGYVVTNNHVVGDNVREITVALPDKREIHGKGIGPAPATDIALLKIDVKGLTVVPWADSSRLQVGEW